ncbi:response regulator transcription factor [Flavobacterium agrisoli]|uniref:Response regulator transcription factor n=1 Tax=Flavobacterium agrisoli TaxID=2793066 RepID=A0A934UL64_9FLAO|nr:response regulator transcription factor [Flavobacterium agrisoli]MBK0371234.1 response regulator transcription factor [Flavobacterium agrisoli]
MFKKVLIAEDFDSINLGICQALDDLHIPHFDHSKYCDDAFLKIRKALADGAPYDLLISDLSFKTDHRTVEIENGDQLIAKVRKLKPELKIIAYSVEDKPYRIQSLFENANLNAFVIKGRNSIEELKKAIQVLATSDSTYISPEVAHVLREQHSFEIDDYDVMILKQLSLGIAQDEMGASFKNMGITPNSKSTLEKRIAKLKDFFKANNTTHLISIAKDMGVI